MCSIIADQRDFPVLERDADGVDLLHLDAALVDLFVDELKRLALAWLGR